MYTEEVETATKVFWQETEQSSIQNIPAGVAHHDHGGSLDNRSPERRRFAELHQPATTPFIQATRSSAKQDLASKDRCGLETLDRQSKGLARNAGRLQ